MRSLRFVAFAALVVATLYSQVKELPPLVNQHRMVFQGDVRHGRAASNGKHATPDLCSFNMELKPGENAIEARMVGYVRQTSTGCEADFDVGIPTVLAQPPQALGAPVVEVPDSPSSDSTITTAEGDVIELGPGHRNSPDFSLIFGAHKAAAGRAQAHATVSAPGPGPNGRPQFSSGYFNGYVLDPANLQVNYINLYLGWVWVNFGTCTSQGSFSRYVTDLWQTGWYVASDSPTMVTQCNVVYNYTYTLFENDIFCNLAQPGYQGGTLAYYWPLLLQGAQNGSLAGGFTWYIGGSTCAAWLRPGYQLARTVN